MNETSVLVPSNAKVGWVGTGVMGKSMASRLQKEGCRLFVHNRTREKARDLLEGGAEWVESPSGLMSKVDLVFMMVGLPQDVESCVFGPKGFLKGLGDLSGKVIVDMTTSSPSLSIKVGRHSRKRSGSFGRPVSGGDIGAIRDSLHHGRWHEGF